MSFTHGTGSHGPREPREPGEVSVCRPVLGDIRLSERHHLKPVSVGVFQHLDVDPPAADRRVVTAGERQRAGNKVNVRPEGQLVSARPAQDQRVGAGSCGDARLCGSV